MVHVHGPWAVNNYKDGSRAKVSSNSPDIGNYSRSFGNKVPFVPVVLNEPMRDLGIDQNFDGWGVVTVMHTPSGATGLHLVKESSSTCEVRLHND